MELKDILLNDFEIKLLKNAINEFDVISINPMVAHSSNLYYVVFFRYMNFVFAHTSFYTNVSGPSLNDINKSNTLGKFLEECKKSLEYRIYQLDTFIFNYTPSSNDENIVAGFIYNNVANLYRDCLDLGVFKEEVDFSEVAGLNTRNIAHLLKKYSPQEVLNMSYRDLGIDNMDLFALEIIGLNKSKLVVGPST